MYYKFILGIPFRWLPKMAFIYFFLNDIEWNDFLTKLSMDFEICEDLLSIMFCTENR